MNNLKLPGRGKYAKGTVGNTRAIVFSERSGMPYYYDEMVIEQGTGLRIHRSEDDGTNNMRDQLFDPIPGADAQILKDAVDGPTPAETFSYYLIDTATDEALYVDLVESGTLNTYQFVPEE